MAIFSLVWVSHVQSKVITSFDSFWTVYAAHSFVTEGDVDLNEFKETIRARNRIGIQRVGNKTYNYFPLGSTILTIPFVYLFELAPAPIATLLPGFEDTAKKISRDPTYEPTAITAHFELERAIASIIIALTAIVILLLAREVLSLPMAFLVALLFALATPAWSTASRGLWPHGPSMLCLSLALLFLVRGERSGNPILTVLAAAPLVFSFFIRPSNVVSIIVLTIGVFLYQRRFFIPYVLMGAMIGGLFLALNFTLYGAMLPKYFRPSRFGNHSYFFTAIAANLVSPSRGLLIFSPWLICSLDSLSKHGRTLFTPWTGLLWTIVIGHIMLISQFPVWWGGHAYGPRFMTDIVPFLVVLSLPAFQVLEDGISLAYLRQCGTKQRLAIAASFLFFIITASWSVFVHARGARSVSGIGWNVYPNNIDLNPSRVWDWSDPQFLR